jgi:hypothetical protein
MIVMQNLALLHYIPLSQWIHSVGTVFLEFHQTIVEQLQQD